MLQRHKSSANVAQIEKGAEMRWYWTGAEENKAFLMKETEILTNLKYQFDALYHNKVW